MSETAEMLMAQRREIERLRAAVLTLLEILSNDRRLSLIHI